MELIKAKQADIDNTEYLDALESECKKLRE
jgi:hypothetical protein